MFKFWNQYFSISMFFFLILYCIRNSFTLPFHTLIENYLWNWIENLLPLELISRNLLNLNVRISNPHSGSGDSLYDYLTLISICLLSFILPITCIAIPKLKNINFWNYNFTIIRYFLAFTMMYYGLAKLFTLQFSTFSLLQLYTTIGESTPMALAWAYFGYSYKYQVIIGIAQLISVLLIYERTTTFGALITFIMALNLITVNYTFDICVKLDSTLIFIFSTILVLKDFKYIYSFFFSNSPLPLSVKYLNLEKDNIKVILNKVIKNCILLYYIYTTMTNMYYYKTLLAKQYEKLSPIYGIYNIQFTKHTIKSEISNSVFDWKQLIFEMENYTTIKYNDGQLFNYSTSIDSVSHSISFYDSIKDMKYYFKISKIDSSSFLLQGVDTMIITRQTVLNNITKRQFHWIAEYPNN